MNEYAFAGSSYQPELDFKRLSNLAAAVRSLMSDGTWRTFAEIKTALGIGSEPSISARLRDLRKAPYHYRVERRRRGDPTQGLFEYSVILPEGAL